MSNVVSVTKRDNRREPIDLDKIHRVLTWAAESPTKLDVSVSQTEIKAHIQFYDGITTEEIHEMLIKTAADLTSQDTPDYAKYAARLAMFHLRKRIYRGFTPWTLLEQVNKMVAAKRYDPSLLTLYSEEEYAMMESWLDHARDMEFSYAGVQQMLGKYLVQDRVTGVIYETPQHLYMLVAACLFGDYPRETRMEYVRRFYQAISLHKLSLPTPIMAGVRTPTRQFSSCVVIEAGDSLDSINATASAVVKYVSQRAGIGINAGRIRALGSPIRGGEAFHTGCIPFYKYFQTAVKSCSQGGVRGGAATIFYPAWHLEVESLLVLKNNRGVDENRVRHMDYGVQFNRLMYQRMMKNGNITLFSPSDVPDLYEAFFADQERFEALYEQYEQDDSIRKTTIKAMDLFTLFMQERASTGRIYLQNVDHCNTHSPFDPSVAPVRQSNLCLEIALPTKPLEHINDENGEIALCTLSAFNLGEINHTDDFDELADLAVRALDSLLDYQDYPVPAARRASMKRRTLGVGFINLAYFLAKNGVKYSDGSANQLVHEISEAAQYHLIKASVALAREKGACPGFDETTYAKGIMPIDTYKKAIDEFAGFSLKYDWDALRQDVVKYGMRNSTLSAMMPSETSSQISNATNGIEPPRGLISVKSSKDGVMKQVVPDIKNLAHQYELVWDMPNNTGYLQLVAIIQKFIDQAISANTNYDPTRYPGDKVPMKQLLVDMLNFYRWGGKTLYYHNTRDGAGETTDAVQPEDEGCPDGACKI